MDTLYSTKATATSGRYGHVNSEDNTLNAEVRTPREMGGTGGTFLNPETLFAAGFAASFNNALNVIIRDEHIDAGETNTTAKVSVSRFGGGFQFAVRLEVEIPGVDRAYAETLVEKAQMVSPYSRATQGNIDVNVVVKHETVIKEYMYF